MASRAVRYRCIRNQNSLSDKSIILFDGVCNMCNGFVNFLILRDKENRFLFGSLQSSGVKELLSRLNYTGNKLSTVLLVENNRVYSESTAVLRIARKMNGLWPFLYVFIIVPPFLRNFLYNLVAKNRYRIFGKRDSCMMPTAELKAKFI
jgi:predicted DCC family thiol-disulfide oxidoreductase YuxK